MALAGRAAHKAESEKEGKMKMTFIAIDRLSLF
jgi:hypothetical protein